MDESNDLESNIQVSVLGGRASAREPTALLRWITLTWTNADTTMPSADRSGLVARHRYVTGTMLFIKAMAALFRLAGCWEAPSLTLNRASDRPDLVIRRVLHRFPT